MGGNALAKHGAKRVSKEVFDLELAKAYLLLESIGDETGIDFRKHCIESYRKKSDFGDIDILVESSLFENIRPENFIAYASHFYEKEIPWIKNGSVLSFGAPLESGGCLQIDLIITPNHSFDFSSAYFAWNDLGNLMGRIAHKMGLKFGHDGLWLPIRKDSRLIDSILVTRNFKAALMLLGYDAERWYEGFDSIEDIFKFVVSSEKFNSDIYLFENRNNKSRTRDKKRPNYNGFLDWVNAQKNLPSYAWNKDKSIYLNEIFEAFPLAMHDFKCALLKDEKKQLFKNNFNGKVVGEITSLSGESLGLFMSKYKKANQSFLAKIEDNPTEDLILQLMDSIKSFYLKNNEGNLGQ